ncbi:MAG TPA: putative quinol monooxygenase, partial [Vicinamibacterales bacterium]|nr:putative quinol monooxygenase [Vicinamibacterales bacterium]
MKKSRREFLAAAGLAAFTPFAAVAGASRQTGRPSTMYGLIGKMSAVPGQRDALAAILLGSTGSMPGCLSYVIATDPADADALWITEVWDGPASHKASLSLPAVQAAITRARPLIAGFSNRVETVPL